MAKKKLDYRSAKTGQFVTKEYARAHPKTTVREANPPAPKHAKKMAKKRAAAKAAGAGAFKGKFEEVSDTVPVPTRKKRG